MDEDDVEEFPTRLTSRNVESSFVPIVSISKDKIIMKVNEYYHYIPC